MKEPYHIPVLLIEAIEALNIQPDGIYVDCTLGGGGHARAILGRLGEKGKLFAFDQDEDSWKNMIATEGAFRGDPRIIFIPQNFRHIGRFLRLHRISAVDGILADLGVSSYQFDETGRGFSIRGNAELDMRMDRRQNLTAFDVVNTYTEQRLHKIFELYGEVTNAKTLARKITGIRNAISLRTTESFRNAIRDLVRGNPNKYYARVFQALRIEVNDELSALKELLQQIPSLLKPGGRVAIITFHSLEDRLVKNFFRRGSFDEPAENPFISHSPLNKMNVITKRPIVPAENEIRENPRSRSAKLRIAERTRLA